MIHKLAYSITDYLIQPINNGANGQYLIPMDLNPTADPEYLELAECYCKHSVTRTNLENIRSKIEQNILQTIFENIKDKTAHIQLVNIGSDFIGLTVILANLYLNDYKNISIVNIDNHTNMNGKELVFPFAVAQPYAQREEIRAKFAESITKLSLVYQEFLSKIFVDANYKYKDFYWREGDFGVHINLRQLSGVLQFDSHATKAVAIVFTQDLGSVTKDTQVVLERAQNLSQCKQYEAVYYSSANGSISKLTTQPAELTHNNASKIKKPRFYPR